MLLFCFQIFKCMLQMIEGGFCKSTTCEPIERQLTTSMFSLTRYPIRNDRKSPRNDVNFYLLFYVAFNSQGHIAMGSSQVEETSAYCTVNHRASASNYQLSNMKRPARDSNRWPQKLVMRTLTATPPSPPGMTSKASRCKHANFSIRHIFLCHFTGVVTKTNKAKRGFSLLA